MYGVRSTEHVCNQIKSINESIHRLRRTELGMYTDTAEKREGRPVTVGRLMGRGEIG